MSRYNSDCTTLTGWTVRWASANTSYSVISDGTSPGGSAIEIARSGAERPLITYDAADGVDQGSLFLYEPGTGSVTGFYIGASGSSGSESGNLVEISESANTIRLWQGSSGSFNSLSTSGGVTINAGTKYWVRIAHFPNNSIAAKIWEYGTQEPQTNNVTGSTFASSDGWTGVSELSSSATTIIHRVSMGTDFDNGCELTDSEIDAAGPEYILISDGDGYVRLAGGSLTNAVSIWCAGAGRGIRTCKYHPSSELIYVTAETDDAIYTIDIYGLGLTSVVSTNQPYGISFDFSNSLLYITNGEATAELFSVADTGGTPTQIATSITGPARCFFNDLDGLIYVAGNNFVASYDNTGTQQVSYPALSSALSVAADDTYVYSGRVSTGGLYQTDIDGLGSWSLVASGTSVQDLAFDPDDKSIIIYADSSQQEFGQYDSLPGISGANDTVLLNVDCRSCDFIFVLGVYPASTPSITYTSNDASFTQDQVAVEMTMSVPTPSATFGPTTGTASDTLPFVTTTAVAATSNIVSGFADQGIHITYSAQDGIPVSEDVIVTFDYPNQPYEYTNFDVNVNVTDITGLGVVSFQCDITYNTTYVQAVGVTPSGVTSGKSFTINLSTPGIISVAYAGVSALTGSGEFLTLNFYAKDSVFPNIPTDLTFTSFLFNEGDPSDFTTDSIITVIYNDTDVPSITYTAINAVYTPSVTTPEITYVAVDAYPVDESGATGYIYPPTPLTYTVVTPTTSFETTLGVTSTPFITYTGLNGSYTVNDVIGIGSTPEVTVTIVAINGVTIGIVSTPTITYQVQEVTELTFGEPRTVKLEAFGNYSAKITVYPKVYDGVNHEGETLIARAVLRDNHGDLTTIPGFLYFFILSPDKTVTGPFECTEVETGHFEYEFSLNERGVYHIRFQDPLANVIEEESFRVAESKVIV